jgi:HlyD family secretion protein
MKNEQFNAPRSIRQHMLLGAASTILVTSCAVGWSATTEFAGAVIAPSVIVVDSNVKKVQHPTGGVVGEIRVRDGARVKAGDVVLRLDATVTQANVTIIAKSLQELIVRRARLLAEQSGAPEIVFPDALISAANEPDVAVLMEGERRVFEARRAAREGQKAQLRERVGQLQEQILGVKEQITAKAREIALIKEELVGVRELWNKNLVQVQRVMALDRDAARLDGERGALISSSAQTKGRITETELQIIQVDQDLMSEISKELADIRGKSAEQVERKVAAEDQLKRIDLIAPQDGVVHQLAAHTVGGVLSAGEAAMLVVPEFERLAVEAKLAPQDIDQLHLGQRTILRFSAFNQRTTPEILGEVSMISADLTTDQRSGSSYYTVRIALAPDEVARLGAVRLMPGMPVESFIQTEPRSLMSYLTKPLADQVLRAFREPQ